MDKYLADILRVFHDHNLFHEGVELIGSWCFKLYQKHLGVKKYPLRTIDIDFLVPIPYRGAKHENFVKELEEIGFRCDFNTDGSMYFWNSSQHLPTVFIGCAMLTASWITITTLSSKLRKEISHGV